jgi:hypothetical protein
MIFAGNQIYFNFYRVYLGVNILSERFRNYSAITSEVLNVCNHGCQPRVKWSAYFFGGITIRVYSPSVGTAFNQLYRVKINDCDGDDPQCGDLLLYPVNNYIFEEDHLIEKLELGLNQSSIEGKSIYTKEKNIRIFNLTGKELFFGQEIEVQQFLNSASNITGIMILVYFDQEGNVLYSRKKFIR